MTKVSEPELSQAVTAWRRHRKRAAARLRSLREAAGLTQLELAAASGITHEAISRLELARRSPQARTLRRLAGALGVAPAELVASPAADRSPEPAPTGHWLTAEEAAAARGRTPDRVRGLLRSGRLGPAVRAPVEGHGHARWLVDAAAVAAFRAPRHHHPPRPGQQPPPGHLAVADFAAAAGLPMTTLQRRLESGSVASVRDGRRRWIPASELDRVGHTSRSHDGNTSSRG